MTTSNTRYARFNSLVTGRIFNAEVVTNQNNGDQFLSVSVISTATKDGADLVYTFTNNNGLMALYNKGLFAGLLPSRSHLQCVRGVHHQDWRGEASAS